MSALNHEETTEQLKQAQREVKHTIVKKCHPSIEPKNLEKHKLENTSRLFSPLWIFGGQSDYKKDHEQLYPSEKPRFDIEHFKIRVLKQ